MPIPLPAKGLPRIYVPFVDVTDAGEPNDSYMAPALRTRRPEILLSRCESPMRCRRLAHALLLPVVIQWVHIVVSARANRLNLNNRLSLSRCLKMRNVGR